MLNIDDLALRITNRVKSKLSSNNPLYLSDESLLKLAKDSAAEETLYLSAELTNTDIWQFANQANSNVSFQETFLKAADILHCSDVLNRSVELLKMGRET